MFECHKIFIDRMDRVSTVPTALENINMEIKAIQNKEDLDSLMEALEFIWTKTNNSISKDAAKLMIIALTKKMQSYIPENINESFNHFINPANNSKAISNRTANNQINNTFSAMKESNIKPISESKEIEKSVEKEKSYLSEGNTEFRKIMSTSNKLKIMQEKMKAAILSEVALLSLPLGDEYISSVYIKDLSDLTELIYSKGVFVSESYEIDMLFREVNNAIPFNIVTLKKIFNEDCTINALEFSKEINRNENLKDAINYISSKFQKSLIQYISVKADNYNSYEKLVESNPDYGISSSLNNKKILKAKLYTESPLFDLISKKVNANMSECDSETLLVESIRLFTYTSVLKTLSII